MLFNDPKSSTSSGPPYYVDLHVNAGETVSIQWYDGKERLLSGPATITMISQHIFPPVPMPVQMPPGHSIQQIVDETGTLKHIILSASNCTSGSTCGGNSVATCNNLLPGNANSTKSGKNNSICSNHSSSSLSSNSSLFHTANGSQSAHSSTAGSKSSKPNSNSTSTSSSVNKSNPSTGSQPGNYSLLNLQPTSSQPFLVSQLFAGQANSLNSSASSSINSIPMSSSNNTISSSNATGNNLITGVAVSMSGQGLLPYPYCCCCCYKCTGMPVMSTNENLLPSALLHNNYANHNGNQNSHLPNQHIPNTPNQPTSKGNKQSLQLSPKQATAAYTPSHNGYSNNSHTGPPHGASHGTSPLHKNRSSYQTSNQPLILFPNQTPSYSTTNNVNRKRCSPPNTSNSTQTYSRPQSVPNQCATSHPYHCSSQPNTCNSFKSATSHSINSKRIVSSHPLQNNNNNNNNQIIKSNGEPIDANRARVNLALALAQNLPYHAQLTMPANVQQSSVSTFSSSAILPVPSMSVSGQNTNGCSVTHSSRSPRWNSTHSSSHSTSGSWRKPRIDLNSNRNSTTTSIPPLLVDYSCSNHNLRPPSLHRPNMDRYANSNRSNCSFSNQTSSLPSAFCKNDNSTTNSSRQAHGDFESANESCSPTSEHYEFGSNESELNSGGSASPVQGLSPKQENLIDNSRLTCNSIQNRESLGTFRKLLVRKASGDTLIDLIDGSTANSSSQLTDSNYCEIKHLLMTNEQPNKEQNEQDDQKLNAIKSDLDTKNLAKLQTSHSNQEQKQIDLLENGVDLSSVSSSRDCDEKEDKEDRLSSKSNESSQCSPSQTPNEPCSQPEVESNELKEEKINRASDETNELESTDDRVWNLHLNDANESESTEQLKVNSSETTKATNVNRWKQSELCQVLAFRLIYTTLSSSSVKLKWNHVLSSSTNDGDLVVSSYQVEMWQNRFESQLNGVNCLNSTVKPHSRLVYNGPIKHCKVMLLLPEQEYAFRVRAVASLLDNSSCGSSIEASIKPQLWLSNTLTITTPKGVGNVVNAFAGNCLTNCQSSSSYPSSSSPSSSLLSNATVIRKRQFNNHNQQSHSLKSIDDLTSESDLCKLSNHAHSNRLLLLPNNSSWIAFCSLFVRDKSCAFGLLLLFCGIACSFAYLAQQLIDGV